MYAQTAYGEDKFSLAGMIRAATLVVPPAQWGAADALTRAVLAPGNQQNDAVNRLQGNDSHSEQHEFIAHDESAEVVCCGWRVLRMHSCLCILR